MIIRLSASQEGTGYCSDNGAGIPDDIKDQVFVPNFTNQEFRHGYWTGARRILWSLLVVTSGLNQSRVQEQPFCRVSSALDGRQERG